MIDTRSVHSKDAPCYQMNHLRMNMKMTAPMPMEEVDRSIDYYQNIDPPVGYGLIWFSKRTERLRILQQFE